MLSLTAFKYETTSFSPPIISIYSPGFKSAAGVKIKETCLEFPPFIKNDCSLNEPVEFPRLPAGLKVPEDIILIFTSEEGAAVTITLTSAVLPFFIVNCWEGVETENGNGFFESIMPILFSVHSVNQT